MIKRTVEEEGSENNKKSLLRYEILQQKLRYRRDVFFSYEDLIVSFGGTAALLLGYNFWNVAKMLHYIINAGIELFFSTFFAGNSSGISRVSYPSGSRY
jgi:hypothetical protein